MRVLKVDPHIAFDTAASADHHIFLDNSEWPNFNGFVQIRCVVDYGSGVNSGHALAQKALLGPLY